ncbi:MAG TPA: ABC transporter ATP-binding protein [Gaiellaceae bacterium]|jgi:branched-chain amino acid transport system ATP-binding protein
MTALLEARGIRTGYGRLPVVFDIDLEVHEGEIVALLGANGAGKTTTLRALSGMLPLQAGDITLDGRSLKGRPPEKIAREGVVHVPQGRGIFPNLRVEETLQLAGALAGTKGTDPVDAMYDVFPRLHERRQQLAGTLSGGEQQMLAIARGLIMRPRVLLIDEMSQGLAPAIVDGLFELVSSLPEQGVSVLIVEQFVTHALEVATRAYVLEKGEVAFAGSAAELAKDEEFVRGSYLGDSTADADDLADLRDEETGDEILRAIEKRAAEEGRDPAEVVMGLLREAMTSTNGKGDHS